MVRRAGCLLKRADVSRTIDEVSRLVEDLVHALLPLLGWGWQGLLDELGEAGFLSQVPAIDLLHMRLLDIRVEAKGEQVTDNRKQKDGPAPGDQGSTSETGSADDTLRVIEKAVD
jgi:hypothetical protein